MEERQWIIVSILHPSTCFRISCHDLTCRIN